MSAAAKATDSVLGRLLQRVRSHVVPPLAQSRHKGQAGRVGVVGGCRQYTGAPYYAAMSSLRAGGDLAFVFCAPEAAQAIKSYSPELMVDAVMREGEDEGDESARAEVVDAVKEYLPRLHVLLVGPGLGRDPFMLSCVADIVTEARRRELPVVIDGDGLYLLAQRPELVRGYSRAVLTPNAPEFARLWKAVMKDSDDDGEDDDEKKTAAGPSPSDEAMRDGAESGDVEQLPAAKLARAMGGVTIMGKGHADWVTNGSEAWACAVAGSPRRCGGQGDVLAGTTATFVGWAAAAVADDGGDSDSSTSSADKKPTEKEAVLLAAFGATCAVRVAAAAAFRKCVRGTVTTDIIPELATACQLLFPVDVEEGLAKSGAKL